jgi:hypothetical protein
MNEQFFLLFYRERIGRLAERLSSQSRAPDVGHDLKIEEISGLLQGFVEEAEDESLCHDVHKSMYFCTRRKGHEGNHCEHGALSWERD